MHQLFWSYGLFSPSNLFLPIFFKKRLGCILDSYFIHRFIIIKYGQVRFRVKSANYYKSYDLFFKFIFAKCLGG